MSVRKYFVAKIFLSLVLCGAFATPVIAQINQSTVVPQDYTTKVVPKNIPSLTLFQTTWLVKETVRLSELTICERAVLKAPEGKYLTLTVNGIGKQIKPGAYKGDVVLSVTDNYVMPPSTMTMMTKVSRNFHTAICIDNGKVVRNKSTPAIVSGGEVTDTKTEGIYVASEEENFNGFVIAGDTKEYTINNVKMDLDGFGDNDFMGVGSAVTAVGKARVTINDSEFNVNGVTRCAVHVGGDSVVTLNNCKISNHSPDSDWKGDVWWDVDFSGTNRLVQLTDNGTVYYNNCQLKGNGWALCSIDGGQKVKMYIKDSTLELTGPRSHGYGAFVYGDNPVTFDHSTVDVNGYPMFVMGKKAQGTIINGSLIKGRRFGVFCVNDDNSVVNIKDSTFQTDKSTLCIKGSTTTINIDNTVMNAKNGVIIQLMDSDQGGEDTAEFRIPVGVADVALPGRDLTTASPTDDVKINIANSKIHGNFFNSTTNIKAYKNSVHGFTPKFSITVNGPAVSPVQTAAVNAATEGTGGDPAPMGPGGNAMGMMGEQKDMRGPKNLGLNFTNVKVDGVISSATQAYKEGLSVIKAETRSELSNVTQTAAETVNNGVIVSLDKDSVWTVTGTSYITALTIAQGAQVKAPEGKSLTMFVNGKKTGIAAGTYKGKIKMAVN